MVEYAIVISFTHGKATPPSSPGPELQRPGISVPSTLLTQSVQKLLTLDHTGPVPSTRRSEVDGTRGKVWPPLLPHPSTSSLFQKHQIFSSINNCNRMPLLSSKKQQPDCALSDMGPAQYTQRAAFRGSALERWVYTRFLLFFSNSMTALHRERRPGRGCYHKEQFPSEDCHCSHLPFGCHWPTPQSSSFTRRAPVGSKIQYIHTILGWG